MADTHRLAARVANQELPNVWLLRGALGSGKTTFVRAVMRSLGYRGGVTSPTFVLRHDFSVRHPRWKHVVHLDAYRIRDQDEEAALDLALAADDLSTLVIIEWPEKLRWRPVRRSLNIRFTHQPLDRKITFSRDV